MMIRLIAFLIAGELFLWAGSTAAAAGVTAQQQESIATAKSKGVDLGKMFVANPTRLEAARGLFKSLKLTEAGVTPTDGGAFCQVECTVGGNAGIVCPVGQSCNCVCAGGGPDCTCRNSNPH